MISKKELEKEREASFKVWFDRFLKHKQIEKHIEIANRRGFKFMEIFISDKDEDLNAVRRMKDDLFIKHLQKVFPEFKITKSIYTTKGRLFGQEYIRDSGLKVVINWE